MSVLDCEHQCLMSDVTEVEIHTTTRLHHEVNGRGEEPVSYRPGEVNACYAALRGV